MKKLLIVLASVIVFTSNVFITSAYSEQNSQSMMSIMNSSSEMCESMMNKAPQDVVIKTVSSQMAKVDMESKITLLVIDKKTGLPVDNANVILHIEKGAPMESMGEMSMMDMMGNMVEADSIGDGKYMVKFTPSFKGYYTMHTHAVPHNKSMMSMMDNHMDIGLIAY